MSYYVYILKSTNFNKHYVGYTTDLKKRLKHHNNGCGQFTKKYRPFKLLYTEKFPSKKLAIKRERQIKKYKSGQAFNNLLLPK